MGCLGLPSDLETRPALGFREAQQVPSRQGVQSDPGSHQTQAGPWVQRDQASQGTQAVQVHP